MRVLGYCGFTRDSRDGAGRRGFARTNIHFDNLFCFRDGEVPFTRFPLGYFGHDAAAALVVDGTVVAAAAEERFTRAKHSLNLAGNTLLPRHAIRYCLDQAGLTLDDLDAIAHYCDFDEEAVGRRAELLGPWVSDEEAPLLEACYQEVFGSMLQPRVVRAQLAAITDGKVRDVQPVRHHIAHAASAYHTSGFDQALILTIDGTGEGESSLLAAGRGGRIEPIDQVDLPTSLGSLYLVLTVFLGFRSLGDEFKVMGLASYGDPGVYRSFFEKLVTLLPDGRYATPLLADARLPDLLVETLGSPRHPDEPIQRRHGHIAAALQEALERAALHTLTHARETTGLDRLCMAGGVALNCAMNGAIARSGLFRDIFIQPAASDEGCALGAALHVAETGLADATPARWTHAHLGPAYSDADVLEALEAFVDGLIWTPEPDIAGRVAAELAAGRVIGWFDGRMEFGPRALGARSILADPRDPAMKDRINHKVKRRESFRPFAPAVLEEAAADWFEMGCLSTSPFMLFTVPVLPHRAEAIPSVTHLDGTARVQTVSRQTNPQYWEVIHRFSELTGVPVVLNTSFNVREEPIVCTPADALRCFLATDIDAVAIGGCFVEKRPE